MAQTWDELRARVDQNGDVVTVTMGELRDIHRVGKLGRYVIDAISDRLHSVGLGHIPGGLKLNQDEQVRIFRHGTKVADICQAVVKPGQANDAKIRSAAFGGAAAIVARLREVLEEFED
jgi:hypothetical protein